MHRPVLYQEIIHALRPRQGGHYVDATLGAGGHAQGILQASQPDGSLLGLDVDPEALAIARQRLAPFGERAILVRASYTTMVEQLQALNWEQVDGVVLDLGVSSMQLESTERGFSFRYDAPLDMRFDPENPENAAYLVNALPEAELADLISRYGEEHRARRVARAIVHARPIGTTRQLAQVVASVTSGGRPGIDPATRTFQALRIAVNRELEALEQVLPRQFRCSHLKDGLPSFLFIRWRTELSNSSSARRSGIACARRSSPFAPVGIKPAWLKSLARPSARRRRR